MLIFSNILSCQSILSQYFREDENSSALTKFHLLGLDYQVSGLLVASVIRL